MEIRKILCATDFSESSKLAMRHAANLAKRYDADLTLFHVYGLPIYTLPEGAIFPTAQQLAELFEHIDASLKEWREEAILSGAARVDTAAEQGGAVEEILKRASAGAYDLIVLGTHGHTGVKHVLLGSVAERIVQRAQRPVLTVRAPPTL